tara:strand:+ start:269 stop:526 length:258 start_codon:yes stop_codon:yes gene_type:complete
MIEIVITIIAALLILIPTALFVKSLVMGHGKSVVSRQGGTSFGIIQPDSGIIQSESNMIPVNEAMTAAMLGLDTMPRAAFAPPNI